MLKLYSGFNFYGSCFQMLTTSIPSTLLVNIFSLIIATLLIWVINITSTDIFAFVCSVWGFQKGDISFKAKQFFFFFFSFYFVFYFLAMFSPLKWDFHPEYQEEMELESIVFFWKEMHLEHKLFWHTTNGRNNI